MTKPTGRPSGRPKGNSTNGSVLTSRVVKPSHLAVAFRHIKPNWKRYLEYVDAAAREGDLEMKKVIEVFGGLTRREQAAHMPEQLCELAGVKTEVLFGAVCQQLYAASKMECNIITAVNMPRVVKRTMDSAATKGGVRDREMVHKHSGFLPTPKPNPFAPPIFINAPGAEISSGPAPRPASLPSMEEEALTMEDLPLLPSGS